MKYGTLSYNPENQTIPLTGKIACRMIQAQLQLRSEKKPTTNSPDLSVWAKEGETVYQLGSAWIKKMDKGGQLISITLDSPDFDVPLNVTAFPVDGNPAAYDIVWQRPRQPAGKKAVDKAVEDDGF